MTMTMSDVPDQESAAGALRREFIDDDLLDTVGGVDCFTGSRTESKERDEPVPGPLPSR